MFSIFQYFIIPNFVHLGIIYFVLTFWKYLVLEIQDGVLDLRIFRYISQKLYTNLAPKQINSDTWGALAYSTVVDVCGTPRCVLFFIHTQYPLHPYQ